MAGGFVTMLNAVTYSHTLLFFSFKLITFGLSARVRLQSSKESPASFRSILLS